MMVASCCPFYDSVARRDKTIHISRERSSMHEELWAGPDLKLQYAEFHLQKMQQSLEGPPRDQTSVALQAAGAIIDTGWQRSFYLHLDAFLSTTRSVPEIIQCCFGEDAATQSKSNKRMSDWFQKQLSSDERGRRRQFKTQFASYYRDFRSRRLSEVRHNIEHRTGVTPATFTIKGLFGDTHTGSPTQPVPISETRKIDDPDLAFLAKPNPIQPRWDDFEIEGKPGFPACREHLDAAIALVAQGRKIVEVVHGTKQVSIPPIY